MTLWQKIGALAGRLGMEGLGAFLSRAPTPPERSIAFTIAIISLGAKMAKADGQVKAAEVAAFREVFHIAPRDEAAAARVFNLARQDVAGFEVYARQIARLFADQPEMLQDILEALFHIAVADGSYHAAEAAFLRTVADTFGIGPETLAAIEARHVPGAGFDPHAILGVAPDADLATIRARWRVLVHRFHPDRMIARGAAPEAARLANARLAAINHAWDVLRRQHGRTPAPAP